jgi:phosphate transport system substrate-binding protein
MIKHLLVAIIFVSSVNHAVAVRDGIRLPFLLYQENDDVIAANAINGVSHTSENISNGRYALARPIYLYAKTKHVDAVKGLQKFLYEFTCEHAIGPDGYLAQKGFVPLDDQGRNSARDAALSLAPIAR